MWTIVMPALMAWRRSPSLVPDPPCKVMGTRASSLIALMRSISRRFCPSPRTMLARSPCMLPTAGASTSTPVVSTNSLASEGVLSAPMPFGAGQDLRAAPDVADFPLDHDRGIDGPDRLHSASGLLHVLLEGQRGAVEDDLVEG